MAQTLLQDARKTETLGRGAVVRNSIIMRGTVIGAGARIDKAIIAEVGATSPKDMSRVMKAATAKLAGMADGKAISAAVKDLLSKLG